MQPRMGALAIRVAEQKEALDRAGELVRPGGRICYATCLLLAEENDDRARILRAVLVSESGLLMTPRRTDTDGVYVSMMIKQRS